MIEGVRPLVGITCCARVERDLHVHFAKDHYVEAVMNGMGGVPMLIPATADRIPPEATLAHLDAVIFTGSPSNVRPVNYGCPPAPEGEIEDPVRDATTLPLIRAAIAMDIPLIGICRGCQEINVATGGTLHHRVHLVPDKLDHRMPETGTWDRKYAIAHTVDLTPGGVLARLTGRSALEVNSLHGQGIDRLGEGLVVEARAPDGLVECVRVAGATFAFGFQWHPEWRCGENPVSAAVFRAFAEAARDRAAARIGAATLRDRRRVG